MNELVARFLTQRTRGCIARHPLLDPGIACEVGSCICKSMTPSPDELLLIGRVVAAFGLNGQIKLRAITNQLDHIAEQVRQVYIGKKYTPYSLQEVFEHKPGLLIANLSGVTTREEAEKLRNAEVYIHERDAAPLAEGEYFLHQLYNLSVETVDGETLGRVTDVLETGANEVLVVGRTEQGDVLIPMIRDVVQELDIAGGRIVVRLLEGLI